MKNFHVEYVQLFDWRADVVGVWLAENADWLLLLSVPVDYVIDGYVLIAKRHIASRKPTRSKRQTERILQLKGIMPEIPANFSFADVLETLRWVEKHHGLFQFQDEEDTMFLGWLRDADGTAFRIHSLTPRGKVVRDYNVWFATDEVKVISFDTDYINSLRLLWQDKIHQQWQMPSNN